MPPAACARGGLQPLNPGNAACPPLAKEIKWITKECDLTPEEAADMLDRLDCSTPLYYTRRKRRDPFEYLLDRASG